MHIMYKKEHKKVKIIILLKYFEYTRIKFQAKGAIKAIVVQAQVSTICRLIIKIV